MSKPMPRQLMIINWHDAMTYIEEEHGLETEGKNYPISMLYRYLDEMQYIPKGNMGIAILPFQDLLDMGAIPDYLAKYHDMTISEYKDAIIRLMEITIEEFPLNNGKVYWEF